MKYVNKFCISYIYVDCVKHVADNQKFLHYEDYKRKALHAMKDKFPGEWDEPGLMFVEDVTPTTSNESSSKRKDNVESPNDGNESDSVSLREEIKYLNPEFFKNLPMPGEDVLRSYGILHLDEKTFRIDDVKFTHFCGLHSELNQRDKARVDLYKFGFISNDALQVRFLITVT